MGELLGVWRNVNFCKRSGRVRYEGVALFLWGANGASSWREGSPSDFDLSRLKTKDHCNTIWPGKKKQVDQSPVNLTRGLVTQNRSAIGWHGRVVSGGDAKPPFRIRLISRLRWIDVGISQDPADLCPFKTNNYGAGNSNSNSSS